jgi:hypothetical protein
MFKNKGVAPLCFLTTAHEYSNKHKESNLWLRSVMLVTARLASQKKKNAFVARV